MVKKQKRFMMTVSYDGAAFSGWQFQPGRRTVQGALEDALKVLFKRRLPVTGASRTDAGVHAAGQICSFAMPLSSKVSARGFSEWLKERLNGILADDVSVRDIAPAADDFHPRYAARGKQYVYTVWNSSERNPLLRRSAWHVPKPLNMAALRRRAAELAKRHGMRISVAVREGMIKFTFFGRAFQYKMVRLFAGEMVKAGLGRTNPEQLAAPACGLCLKEVTLR